MRRLITPERVVEIAMTNEVDLALIRDTVIEATQLRWIKPVLGNDLWDEIDEQYGKLSTANQKLVDKLEIPLAFFVKAEIVPDMSINSTSAGLQVIRTEYSQPATDKQRGQIQDTSLNQAKALLDEVIRWVEKDENIVNYPLYSSTVEKKVNKNGGIVF